MSDDSRDSKPNSTTVSSQSKIKNVYIILIILVMVIVGIAAFLLLNNVPANKMVGTWEYDGKKITISEDSVLYDDIFGRWGQCNYYLRGSILKIIAIRGEEKYKVTYPTEDTMVWTERKTGAAVNFTRINHISKVKKYH